VPFVGVLIDWLPPLSIPAAKPVQLEYAPSSHEGTWAVSLVSQWIGVAPGANLSHFLADMDLSLGQRLHLVSAFFVSVAQLWPSDSLLRSVTCCAVSLSCTPFSLRTAISKVYVFLWILVLFSS
jgi:hypothetical protein